MDTLSLKRQTKDFKVLYVEDSTTIRNITKKMMNSYFEHIDIAEDGSQALEMYVDFNEKNDKYYDIVITDLEMPNMDGQELAREILSMDFTQEIVVISGVTDFKVITSLVNDGITKFLSKPIEDESFYEIIESITYALQIKELQKKEADELEATNKKLKEKNEKNRETLKEKVMQLEEALEENASMQKAKEDFFTNISHEMRTPLNSILGFSSMLKKRLKDDEKSLMMVNTIFETGTDLDKLVAAVLDLQKIQSNTLELKESTFSPQEDITNLFNAYKEKAEKKKQSYELVFEQKIPEILNGYTNRVLQVIDVVLDNAIKFTNVNGKIRLHVEYDDIAQKLNCSIQDNGIGIEKQDQKKIYKLEQLDSSVNRSYEGAGLGLNIAYNIMILMKGKITLRSVFGRGSIFDLEFPLTT